MIYNSFFSIVSLNYGQILIGKTSYLLSVLPRRYHTLTLLQWHPFQANTTDELKKETWCNQRINRLIIDYLLRAGYFETAQKLAEQSDVEDMCNRSVFMIAKQVSLAFKSMFATVLSLHWDRAVHQSLICLLCDFVEAILFFFGR